MVDQCLHDVQRVTDVGCGRVLKSDIWDDGGGGV